MTGADDGELTIPGPLDDEDERTIPTRCDGDPGCDGTVTVLFLGSGDRMCAHCAVDRLNVQIAEPAFRDTERPKAEAEASRPAESEPSPS